MDYDSFDANTMTEEDIRNKIFNLLKSRPCLKEDVAKHLNLSEHHTYNALKNMRLDGIVQRIRIGRDIFFGLRAGYRK